MPDLFKKALQLLVGSPDGQTLTMPKKSRPLKTMTERDLINLESEIGSKIFGEAQQGGRREFFNLDRNTWIWYEEWLEGGSKKRSTTIRYEVTDQGVLKVQEGARYNFLDGAELDNFHMAVQIYYEQVMRGVYKRDPNTGNKLI